MLPDLQVWRALCNELAFGRGAVLVAVVEHRGSSPGRAGWLMAVGQGGWLAGTTGGGPAEQQVLKRAADMARAGILDPVLVTQIHRAGAEHASGMLCGGEQMLALVPLSPADGRRVAVVIGALTAGHTLTWTITAGGLSVPGAAPEGFTTHDGQWSYRHSSGPSHRVVIVGAGHVGAALARVLVPLGFWVSGVDERPGAELVGVADEFSWSRRGYEELADVVPPGERTFVTIATHSPDRDAAALAALAGVQLGYLGVLGSRAKLAHLPDTARVHAPMGLGIGSHTPQEIAVSVAAELVAVRSAQAAQRGAMPVS